MGRDQRLITTLLPNREIFAVPGAGQLGPGLLRRRIRFADRRGDASHLRLGCGQVLGGLLFGQAEVLGVDLQQGLTGRHLLVVGDEQVGHPAADLGRHRYGIAGNVGIVRRFVGQVAVQTGDHIGSGGGKENDDGGAKQPAATAAARLRQGETFPRADLLFFRAAHALYRSSVPPASCRLRSANRMPPRATFSSGFSLRMTMTRERSHW
jgi:hypothetical protein